MSAKNAKPAAKAVATRKTEDQLPLDLGDRPAYLDPESGRGSEGVTSQDLTIPRLDIVQQLSPQVKQGDPLYNEDAEEGDIMNSVTKQLIGKSVTIVPVYFRKEYVVWKSRKKGGGFFGAFATEAEAARHLKQEVLVEEGGRADDYEVLDTAQHFCLLVRPDGDQFKIEEVVVSMNKSKMKASRQWNTLVTMAGGDRFSRFYTLSTVDDKNKNGDEYKNWSVQQRGYVPEEVFRRAEAVYEAVRRGERDVDRRTDDVVESDHM